MQNPTSENPVHTEWHCENIRISHRKEKLEQLERIRASNDKDVVRLHFGLKGDYEFSYRQLGRSFDLVGGHHNLMYSRGIDMEVRFKTLEVETFGVQFSRDFFIEVTQGATERMKRFSESVLAGQSAILSPRWGVLDLPTEQVIRQVIQNQYAPGLQKMFLLSKSIELLVLASESYTRAESGPDGIIRNKSDKEKILAARDLINDHLNDPPNLSEIAKAVGLNEYKLKRGFKETFQATIFGYLTGQRLNLALQYLKDTEKTSAEIGYLLGYATPQHFNNAFKRHFGFTPNSVRKNPD